MIGVEGEVTGSSTAACNGARTPAGPAICAKAGRDFYAGAPKAGSTNARVRLTADDGTTTTTLGGQNLDGVRVGAGLEHSFGGRFCGKAEYRYSNYQGDVSRHQLLAGLRVRF